MRYVNCDPTEFIPPFGVRKPCIDELDRWNDDGGSIIDDYR